MFQTAHLIANNVLAPGFGPADSRSVPCLAVSRRVDAFSSGSSLGERSLLTRVKFISHKRVSNAASVLCGARPGNYRRNPDFYRDRNEDRDNNDAGPDEYDILYSKNGTQAANARPGQMDKEAVEMFRKIQPLLRTGEGKKNVEIGEMVKKLTGDHYTGEGSIKIRASENGSATFGHKAASGTQSEGRSWNRPITKKKEIISTPEPKVTPVIRPASSFRRKSPIPSAKYQPIYNSEDGDNDFGEKQQPELDEESESESDEEFESEQDLERGPISSFDDEYIFSDMAKGERLEEENSLDEGDQQPTEHEDLGSLKLTELRELAKSRDMKGYSKLKKSDLLELLSGT